MQLRCLDGPLAAITSSHGLMTTVWLVILASLQPTWIMECVLLVQSDPDVELFVYEAQTKSPTMTTKSQLSTDLITNPNSHFSSWLYVWSLHFCRWCMKSVWSVASDGGIYGQQPCWTLSEFTYTCDLWLSLPFSFTLTKALSLILLIQSMNILHKALAGSPGWVYTLLTLYLKTQNWEAGSHQYATPPLNSGKHGES